MMLLSKGEEVEIPSQEFQYKVPICLLLSRFLDIVKINKNTRLLGYDFRVWSEKYRFPAVTTRNFGNNF